jgi:hypothetical protein
LIFPCDYALLGEIGDINIALKRKQWRLFLSINGDKMTSKIHLYITYLIIASDMKQFYMILSDKQRSFSHETKYIRGTYS